MGRGGRGQSGRVESTCPATQPLLIFTLLGCRPWFARTSAFRNTVLAKQNMSKPAVRQFITRALTLLLKMWTSIVSITSWELVSTESQAPLQTC